MQTREIGNEAEWEALLDQHPNTHPLQTWGWGEVKRASGWGAWRVAITEGDELRAAAQVLTRHIPHMPLSMIYLPRGPIIEPNDSAALSELMEAVDRYGRSVGAIFCKVDPAWISGTTHELASAKFRPSNESVQVTDTYTIDLALEESAIFARMNSKTRQYIRKGEKEGVTVVLDTTGEWLKACYNIYVETAQNAHFGLHPYSYYEDIFHHYDRKRLFLYVAMSDGQPASFLWLAGAGKVAVELYGGISNTARKASSKANYVIKWHAIQAMKKSGYTLYDLNGRVHEGLKQFKEGFGPDKIDWIGPFDRVYHPLMYQAWTRGLPLARRFLARDAATEGATSVAVK
jgi:lipid II:glycine glycyltransferase (peptidoglycan interpeptide bridge formation enzyme)